MSKPTSDRNSIPTSGPHKGSVQSKSIALDLNTSSPEPATVLGKAGQPRPGWERVSVDERELRLALDTANQELLHARDGLIGAENEAGVLRAKLIEIEAQLQARDREIGELSAKLRALEQSQETATPGKIERAEAMLGPMARQLKAAAAAKRPRPKRLK